MVSIEGQAESAASGAKAGNDATAAATVRDESGLPGREEVLNDGSAPTQERLSDDIALLARCVARAHYHEEREEFLGLASRAFNFLVVVFGSAAFAAIAAGDAGWAGQAAAFSTTVIAAAQLVFDFPGKIRTHVDLRRRNTQIGADATVKGADIGELNHQYILASADSPPTFFALEAEAYNHAQLAIGQSENTLLYIPWWHRVTKNVFRHSTTNYRYRSEIEAEKRAKAR